MQAHPPATPAQPAAVPAALPSTSILTATYFTKPSAAATTNPPAATTAPHANTFTTIHTVILSAAKDLSFVMPDPIGHPQTSSHLQ